MESLDTVIEDPGCCRLCMSELIDLPEYYAIDEQMRGLILTLTEISVKFVLILCRLIFYRNSLIRPFQIDLNDKKYPTALCPTCFDILDQFNETKCTWIVNQQKFVEKQQQIVHESVTEVTEFDVDDDENIEGELKGEVDEQNYEMLDEESVNEYGFPEEYVEDQFVVAVQFVEDLPSSPPTTSPEAKKKVNRPKTTKSEESKEIGKNTYQKLLKKCEECGKMIEKNRLDGHMNKHNNVKPYVCSEDECGKSFYCRLLYRLHKTSIHTGTLVTCDICDKQFPSQRSLYAHSLRHRNIDRYHCDYCERKFNNSNSLKRHMAIHSGIREWKCENCSASFYRKFNLGKFREISKVSLD